MWLLLGLAVVLSLTSLVTSGCPGVVSRDAWDAISPQRVNYLTRPVSTVIIQHTVSEKCFTDELCQEILHAIQDYHKFERGFFDIGSSFYVGGNGKIYEGRGWLHIGAHTYEYNNRSIGISFIGNYNDDIPTDAQLDAVMDLLRCGVEEGHLTQDYHVVGYKQLIPSESPGRKLYNVIRTWPEWLENISSIHN